MKITIKKEQKGDYQITEEVVTSAFKNAEYSDHNEHHLVSKIRQSDAFIPELSLVAINQENNRIVGHILLSKIQIAGADRVEESLALAPVSVLPEYQDKGIGKALIREALKTATELDYGSVIVPGHPDYYPKFGFKAGSTYGIQSPFEVPEENFMAVELQANGLENVSGIVEYPSVFFEE